MVVVRRGRPLLARLMLSLRSDLPVLSGGSGRPVCRGLPTLALGCLVCLANSAAAADDPVVIQSCLPALTLADYGIYFGGFALILVTGWSIKALRNVLGRY